MKSRDCCNRQVENVVCGDMRSQVAGPLVTLLWGSWFACGDNSMLAHQRATRNVASYPGPLWEGPGYEASQDVGSGVCSASCKHGGVLIVVAIIAGKSNCGLQRWGYEGARCLDTP